MDRGDLLRRQERLQQEAAELLAALDPGLERVGVPQVVGAMALRTMVARDIDITVTCARLDRTTIAAVTRRGSALMLHPQVREVTLRDDTGPWNVDPRYPDGVYLGIRCRSAAGDAWTLDVWFVDRPECQPDLADVRRFGPVLDDATRAVILAIKQRRRPAEGVTSRDVYEAVTEHGVETVAQFEQWCRHRGR